MRAPRDCLSRCCPAMYRRRRHGGSPVSDPSIGFSRFGQWRGIPIPRMWRRTMHRYDAMPPTGRYQSVIDPLRLCRIHDSRLMAIVERRRAGPVIRHRQGVMAFNQCPEWLTVIPPVPRLIHGGIHDRCNFGHNGPIRRWLRCTIANRPGQRPGAPFCRCPVPPIPIDNQTGTRCRGHAQCKDNLQAVISLIQGRRVGNRISVSGPCQGQWRIRATLRQVVIQPCRDIRQTIVFGRDRLTPAWPGRPYGLIRPGKCRTGPFARERCWPGITQRNSFPGRRTSFERRCAVVDI